MILLEKLTIHYIGDTINNPSITHGWTATELEDLLGQWTELLRSDIETVHFDTIEVFKDTWRAHALVMGVT